MLDDADPTVLIDGFVTRHRLRTLEDSFVARHTEGHLHMCRVASTETVSSTFNDAGGHPPHSCYSSVIIWQQSTVDLRLPFYLHGSHMVLHVKLQAIQRAF